MKQYSVLVIYNNAVDDNDLDRIIDEILVDDYSDEEVELYTFIAGMDYPNLLDDDIFYEIKKVSDRSQ